MTTRRHKATRHVGVTGPAVRFCGRLRMGWGTATSQIPEALSTGAMGIWRVSRLRTICAQLSNNSISQNVRRVAHADRTYPFLSKAESTVRGQHNRSRALWKNPVCGVKEVGLKDAHGAFATCGLCAFADNRSRQCTVLSHKAARQFSVRRINLFTSGSTAIILRQ